MTRKKLALALLVVGLFVVGVSFGGALRWVLNQPPSAPASATGAPFKGRLGTQPLLPRVEEKQAAMEISAFPPGPVKRALEALPGKLSPLVDACFPKGATRRLEFVLKATGGMAAVEELSLAAAETTTTNALKCLKDKLLPLTLDFPVDDGSYRFVHDFASLPPKR